MFALLHPYYVQLWILNHIKSMICTSWDFLSYYVVLGVQLVFIEYWIDVGKIAREKLQERKELKNEKEEEKDEDNEVD